MKKNKFSLLAKLVRTVHAESQVTTAVVDGNGAVKFTESQRMVYSKEIEFHALPNMRFYQFATIHTELGVEPGLTISMMTYDNLKLGGALVENTPMQTQAISGSLKQITVQEYGNAVANSELLLRTSFDDIMTRTTTLLGRDYAMVLDRELRDCALSGTNIVYADKKDGTKITARKDLTDECKLKVSTIKDAVEILNTNNAPLYPTEQGAYWICFVHPHQDRSLRDDSAWINASNYGAPEQLFTGEIGRIDNVRFITTTMMCNGGVDASNPAYDATLVSGAGEAGSENQTNVYQAVLFGDAYYGVAFALPVELRDNGVTDFGRKHELAWYSIFGVALLHDDYGVVIETA